MSESNIHEQIRNLFCNDDAPGVCEALNKFPALKAQINEPIGDFNSPPILNVRSREMLDVLIDAGADINARKIIGVRLNFHGSPGTGQENHPDTFLFPVVTTSR